MYFPYLRGKQFELLALKEMAGDLAESGLVRPIIEPVKQPDGALARCLGSLLQAGVEHGVVVNPTVGDLRDSASAASDVTSFLGATTFVRTQPVPVVIADSGPSLNAAIQALGQTVPDIVYGNSLPLTPSSAVSALASRARYNVIDDKTRLRRLGPGLRTAKAIKLGDPFPQPDTNGDFVDIGESFFTDEHLYFGSDGYVGFSDFLTIGSRYRDGGGLPKTVVIHLSFQRGDDQAIYVRHFCSDSNENTSDPAGKFGEAVAKLVAFANEFELVNPAIDAFRKYYSDGAFPGLGTIKKVSIQNHLYVVMKALRA